MYLVRFVAHKIVMTTVIVCAHRAPRIKKETKTPFRMAVSSVPSFIIGVWLLIFVVCVSSATTTTPDSPLNMNGWIRVGDCASTDVVSFTISLSWQKTSLLDDYQLNHKGGPHSFKHDVVAQIERARLSAATPHESISTALRLWRQELTPSEVAFNTVLRALGNNVSSLCQRGTWDTIRCLKVPVSLLTSSSSPFSGVASFSRFRHPDGLEEGDRVFCVDCASTALTAKINSAMMMKPAHPNPVAHVTDLTPPPLAKRVRQHHVSTMDFWSELVASSLRSPRQLSSSSSSASSSPLPKKKISSRPFRKQDEADWPWPHPTTGGTPTVLGLNALATGDGSAAVKVQIVLALFCDDGSSVHMDEYQATTCASFIGNLPSKIAWMNTHFDFSTLSLLRAADLPNMENAAEATRKETIAILETTISAPAWSQISDTSLSAFAVFSDPFGGTTTSSNTTTRNFWGSDYEDNVMFPSNVQSGVSPHHTTVFAEQGAWIKDIQNLYNLPTTSQIVTSILTTHISQGVWEYNTPSSKTVSYNTSDVELYLRQQGLNLNTIHYIGSLNGVDGGEASLDIQLMTGLANDVPTYFYSNTDPDVTASTLCLAEALLVWLQDISSATGSVSAEPPSVWSMSYGQCDNVCAGTVAHANDYFRILSVSGVTFVASTGDSGAKCGGSDTPYYGTNFPASSPHVIAVGATAGRSGFVGGANRQEACSAHASEAITSSGGFSQAFGLPHFQASTAMYPYRPNNGRAIPDVSALGSNIFIIRNGKRQTVYGTSASAPIVASIFTLLNLYRSTTSQKAPISLANEFVYDCGSSCFTDIVKGNNCYGESALGLLNFFKSWTTCYDAGTGWDPVTGLGTPIFASLKTFASSFTQAPSLAPFAPSSASTPWFKEGSNRYIVYGACAVAAMIVAVVFIGLLLRNRRLRRQREQQDPMAALMAEEATGPVQ